MKRNNKKSTLEMKYPPSLSCNCQECKSFCIRPGWWTVIEAEKAFAAGYGNRMMLEIAPDFTFAVLSPAFKNCEGNFALQEYAGNGCNFLVNDKCEIYDSGLMLLECRFCHHDRTGLGIKCHADIEQDWKTVKGQLLVKKWMNVVDMYNKYRIL